MTTENHSDWALIMDLDNTIVRCSEYYADAKNRFAMLVCEKTGISQDIALSVLDAIDLQSIRIDGFGRSRFPKSFQAASAAIDILVGKEPSKTRGRQAWVIGNSVFKAPYTLYAGAEKALLEIKDMGYKIFLCTKGDAQVQARKIRINGLQRIFPESHIYIDVVKNKDHFLKIIQEHNLDKDKTIAVGDSVKDDIGSAHRAGIKSILVSSQHEYGWAYENEENKPTLSIEDIKDLPKCLRENFS